MLLARVGRIPEWRRFAAAGGMEKARRQHVLESVFQGRIHALVWKLVVVLERHRRLADMSEIAEGILRLHDARTNVARGVIQAPFPIGGELIADIAQRLGKRLGVRVVLQPAVRKDLIGGFRVRVGDRVFDGSVASWIEKWRRSVEVAEARASG